MNRYSLSAIAALSGACWLVIWAALAALNVHAVARFVHGLAGVLIGAAILLVLPPALQDLATWLRARRFWRARRRRARTITQVVG